MKQAIGELNLSVIVVVIVALLTFFFFSVLWPSIKNGFAKNTRCDEAICPKEGAVPSNGEVTCTYRDEDGNTHDIICAWKG